jgi:beta-lactamase class D
MLVLGLLIVSLSFPLTQQGIPSARTADGECFVVARLDGPLPSVPDGSECARPTAPASTFKIPHALIALQTGVIDAKTTIKWDGSKYDFQTWQRDHTLDSAMKSSVYPFFQRTATMIGEERMRGSLASLRYGADTFRGDVTTFWTNGNLVVSPLDQLSFLQRMFGGRLPIDRRHVEAVKATLLMPAGRISNAAGIHDFPLNWPKGTRVRAKTGNGRINGERVSWLVGHLEADGNEYVFAARVRSSDRPLTTTAGAQVALRGLNRARQGLHAARRTSHVAPHVARRTSHVAPHVAPHVARRTSHVAPNVALRTLHLERAVAQAMAERALITLEPAAGERILLRVDPGTMPEFPPVLRGVLEKAGAKVDVITGATVDRFDERLGDTDIYVWMPGGSAITSHEQSEALKRWLDRGGARRELHCHWSDGTMTLDQRPVPQTPAIDRLYAAALDIDYAALNRSQDQAIALLRSGEIRVTTPLGTDVRFRTGDRPFNKQNGDGSKERVANARMRIDRHIELPAGIIRVAPEEASVHGVMVVPAVRVGAPPGVVAKNVRLEFENGRVVKISAGEHQAAFDQLLEMAPALANFREFGLGMNPVLAMKPGDTTVLYYGYGAGFVRLSLGDNEEVGGSVRGGMVMWNFFPDATVTSGGETLVKDGQLVRR